MPKPTTAAPLSVATLNLRCRLDEWPARKPLIVAALARLNPDLIALQEDCLENGRCQADELRAELGALTKRDYDLRYTPTHMALDTWQEGISIVSAHPIEGHGEMPLPTAHLARKALWVDVKVRGSPLRFVTTHLDFGADAESVRQESAELLVAALPTDRAAIVAGDLNATPSSQPVTTLLGAMRDLWTAANPSQLGLTFPAASPDRRIDYVLGPPSVAAVLLGARLLDESREGTWLSDHRGVAAAFEWPLP